MVVLTSQNIKYIIKNRKTYPQSFFQLQPPCKIIQLPLKLCFCKAKSTSLISLLLQKMPPKKQKQYNQERGERVGVTQKHNTKTCLEQLVTTHRDIIRKNLYIRN